MYYQRMSRQKRASGTAGALCLFGGMLAFYALLAPPASADIYRWEDESGGIHFTDDISNIPAKQRGKAREIQKTPPEAGKPSLSTMGAPPPPGTSYSPQPSNGGEVLEQPAIGEGDDATQAEKLRAKIDAKERFVGAIDQKRSLAFRASPNRYVSPSDMELYEKYKEELPADRERLKQIESRLPPVR